MIRGPDPDSPLTTAYTSQVMDIPDHLDTPVPLNMFLTLPKVALLHIWVHF